MNGKFFKLTYQSIIKIIQAEKTFEEYLVGISKAFSLPLTVIRELTGTFKDDDGDTILINTEMDYGILLNSMEKGKIKTLKINLSKQKAQDQYTQSSQFEVIPLTSSHDMTIQTDEVISKHVQIQTELTKQAEVKEGTCQTNSKKAHTHKRKPKHQKGTLEYEKHQARREVKEKFRDQLKAFKKQTLTMLYENSDLEVEKRYKERNSNVESFKCKGCGMNPITDILYKCSQCVNYCYCEKCEEKLSFDHRHCFIKFRLKQQQQVVLLDMDVMHKYINVNIDSLKKAIDQQPISVPNALKDLTSLKKLSTSRYMASCTNKTLEIFSKNNKSYQKFVFNLKNEGNINWPAPCFLSCNKDKSIIRSEEVKIQREVAPNETISVEITLDFTDIKDSKCYFSEWQLENEKREKFGNAFKLKIHCSYDDELAYCGPAQEEKNEEFVYVSTNNLIQSYESFSMAMKLNYNKLAQEMQKEYKLKDDKYAIMNALMLTAGNKQAAYQNLINQKNNICVYHQIK